jgi:signal transduction histidine kinase
LLVHSDEETICFEVTDSGKGIPPDVLPNIWTPFYRDSFGSGDGAGLGLALVKEFTQAMKGSVSVQSKVGQGASFFVRLPRA